MQISCPSCKNPVISEDININKMIAKCASCQAVFRFSEDDLATASSQHNTNDLEAPIKEESTGREHSTDSNDPSQKRPQEPMIGLFWLSGLIDLFQKYLQEPAQPDVLTGVTFQRDEQHLRIHWRWFRPAAYFVAGVSLFVNLVLISWMRNVGGSGLGEILFSLPFCVAGGGLIFLTLALFLNETTVTVQHGKLSIRHAPLPWWGNRTLPIEDLEQLFCKKNLTHSKDGKTGFYELHAILRNGQQITLLQYHEEPEKVLFIEQLLEEHLGIVDRPVLGEYKG